MEEGFEAGPRTRSDVPLAEAGLRLAMVRAAIEAQPGFTVDDREVRACITPVSSIGAAQITTIEAIGQTPIGQAVQKAWLDVDVMQCGYCQAGQIMAATALIKTTPKPTDKEIDIAMQGNACRCGTYVRIRQAIKTAAGVATADTREV